MITLRSTPLPEPTPGLRRWMVAVGSVLALAFAFAVQTAIDDAGPVVLWENAHWTLFALVGLVLAVHGVQASTEADRSVRIAIAAAAAMWFAGMIVWDIQSILGLFVVPAPSDLLFLATIVPAAAALELAVRRIGPWRDRLGIYLDAGITFLAIAAVMTLLFGGLVTGAGAVADAVLLSMPISFLSLAGAGLTVALATGAEPRRGGIYALLVGTLLLGAGYLPWVANAPLVPPAGTWSNYLFSAGTVIIGMAGATFRHEVRTADGPDRLGAFIKDALPVTAVAIAVGCLAVVAATGIDGMLVLPLGWSVIVAAAARQVLLVHERSKAVRLAQESSRDLSAAEARHRGLIERIPAVVYIDERATPDTARSTLTFVSPQVTKLLSYTVDELMNDPALWYALVHPDDAEEVALAEDIHFSSGSTLNQTFRIRDRDGRELWVRDEATLIRLPDGRRQSHGVLLDVTAQKEAEEAVRASEDQQRRIIETASSAYVAMAADGHVTDWNERATETFGWTSDEAIGRRLSDLIVPPDSREAHEAGLRRFAATGTGPLIGRRVEVTALDRSGRRFPVELTIWPVRIKGAQHYSALIHDITERRRLEDELRHQAFHDSLTGLANRALFSDRLDHALERRATGAVAVLFFDIDDFKLINDGLGHPAGDRLLIEVAQRLTAMLRAGDTAARLGGDEFGILLEESTQEEAASVADRIVRAFGTPFDISGHEVVASASIGIAFGQPGSDPASVLREADAAMYAAKRGGKGAWQAFDASMAGDGLRELEFRADLKLAIETGELAVAYQPIVELATRRTVGVEALARWHHPTRGDIAPSQFIPLAEAADLIVPLGRWVLTEACRTVQDWRAAAEGPDDLRLSVNISPRQLLHGSIIEHVQMALADSGLEPADLTLEITEGVLVEEAGASLAVLERLKALGVRIAIDDFGTGYSSLSYLSRLPIDVLKIDRSFVADIGTSRQAAALVRSIVKIGQTLHLETVAEGVETEEQLDRLIRLGTKLGQGYLFARPLAAAELATLLLDAGTSDAA